MSFQAYLNTIEANTGKTPDDFRRFAEEKGFTKEGNIKENVKATDITNWLKEELELGHGHLCPVKKT